MWMFELCTVAASVSRAILGSFLGSRELCSISVNACDKMQWIAVEILVSVWTWTGDNVSLLPITGSPLLILLSVRTPH